MADLMKALAESVKRARAATLSKASPYEQMFGVRHRRAGRPPGSEPMFELSGMADVDPLIAAVSRRRAFAVVHEEQRERLSAVFAAEVAVLRRRGVDQVREDVGQEASSVQRAFGKVVS